MKITSGFLLAASNVLAENPADGLGPADAPCTSNLQCQIGFEAAQCECEKQADGNTCVEGGDAASCACRDGYVATVQEALFEFESLPEFGYKCKEDLPDTMPCEEDDACPANSYCTDIADPAEDGAFLAECTCNDGFIKSDDGESCEADRPDAPDLE